VSRKNVWVTGNRSDGYRVVSEGASRAASLHDTQAAAITVAATIAAGRGVEVIIQGNDGLIREKNSYGNDPKSSKG